MNKIRKTKILPPLLLAALALSMVSCEKINNSVTPHSHYYEDTSVFNQSRCIPQDYGWPFVLCLQDNGSWVAFQDAWECNGYYQLYVDSIQMSITDFLDVYTCPFLHDTLIPNIGRFSYDNSADSMFLTNTNIKFEFVKKECSSMSVDSLYPNLPMGNTNSYVLVSYIK